MATHSPILFGIVTAALAAFALPDLRSGPSSSDEASASLSTPAEHVRIRFAGKANIILAEAPSSEYAPCDPVQQNGTSFCEIESPGTTVGITVVIRDLDTRACQHAPLVTLGNETFVTRLTAIEMHPSAVHCRYTVLRFFSAELP